MVKIKLSPMGKTRAIRYRIVVAEENSKVTGRAIDTLGYWLPQTKKLQLDKQKLAAWLAKGAQPTTSVRNLLWKTS